MTYTHEFKIGDLVSFKYIGEQVRGVIVDVATVNDGPDYTYKVEWKQGFVTVARWFTADKLEFTSPMKFKLGDYVKVNYYDEIFPGNIVEIARVIRRYKVRIMYTDGRTKEIWFDEDEIVDGFTPGKEGPEMKSEKAFADKKTEYQKGFAAGYETRKIEEITEAVLNAESYGKTEDGKELRSVKDILEILNKYLPCE